MGRGVGEKGLDKSTVVTVYSVLTEMTDVAQIGSSNPRRVVLPGGSGHIGTILAKHFHSLGDRVAVLSRRAMMAPWRVVLWDGRTLGNWTHELENADLVINLSGRSVNCRYTPAKKQEILNSRLVSTAAIKEAIHRAAVPPRLWINLSTATIYRHSMDRPMDEDRGELGGNETDIPDAWRFSYEVARRWEEAFFELQTPFTRKIALRSAMVMSRERGGAFGTLLALVRFGLGGPFGGGNQMMSWIHETDLVRAIEFLSSRDEISNVVNLSSPSPLPNREFMNILRQAWGIRFGLPASKWMLEFGTFLLRTESELVLKSRWVVPGRLLSHGFHFQFPQWPDAARDLMERWKHSRSPRSATCHSGEIQPGHIG